MNYLSYAAIIVGLFIIFALYSYVKKSGKFSNSFIDNADNTIEIAHKIINTYGFSKEVKSIGTVILDIADKAVDYVEGLSRITDVSDKVTLSSTIVTDVLSILGITASDKDKILIDTVIEEGLKFFEKQSK